MDPISIMSRYAPTDGTKVDQASFGFKLAIDPVPHRRYKQAMFQIAELHLRRRR